MLQRSVTEMRRSRSARCCVSRTGSCGLTEGSVPGRHGRYAITLLVMAASLIEIDAARELVLEHARALESESVPLREACGRVLARAVASTAPVPPFDSSAMDGFAVRARDLAGASAEQPASLALIDESRAGSPAAESVREGAAVAISTGAMIPTGADAVVELELTARRDGRIEVLEEVARGANVRRAGEDVQAGAEVLEPGTGIGAAELGVLASLGAAQVECFRRPRVALLTTGDEL